jgi:hemin uptake protein HemP
MTNLTRSSTLSVRRPAAAAPASRAGKPASQTTVPAPMTRNGNAQEPLERIIQSDTLLQGRSHISIVHNGETYQLRATRLGKLILTK